MAEWMYQSTDSSSLKTTTTTRFINAIKKSGIQKDIERLLDKVTGIEQDTRRSSSVRKSAINAIKQFVKDLRE